MKPLIHVVAIAIALLILSQLGLGITVASIYSAVIVAIIWGLVMLIIRPILGLLTLPLNILTLGLFSFILNALLFWFISTFIQGFSVAGFVPALIGSVVLTLVSSVLHHTGK